MPGQIKIDDGAGNYTVLTNGGSLGSDKTITIPNTTGTMALTSDISAGGLSSAQQFRLTANVTTTGDLTANWEVPDTENQGNMGSLVSESSGIFTFSETGFYFINFGANYGVNPAGDATAETTIHLTNDNSTYTASATGTFGGATVRNAGFGNVSTIIDVTNTTNDKVKFNFTIYAGTPRIIGSTTTNKTYVTFMKLGDT